jgi:hypothetical protein
MVLVEIRIHIMMDTMFIAEIISSEPFAVRKSAIGEEATPSWLLEARVERNSQEATLRWV